MILDRYVYLAHFWCSFLHSTHYNICKFDNTSILYYTILRLMSRDQVACIEGDYLAPSGAISQWGN